MARRPKTAVGGPPSTPGSVVATIPAGTSAGNVATWNIDVVLSPAEESFARNFVATNNATQSYIDAVGFKGVRQNATKTAWAWSNKPHILKRVREYESAAAAATVIDYAAILEHDRQIVEGSKYADQISQHRWFACRYCYGVNHQYQWVDYGEYITEMARITQENEDRVRLKRRLLPLPVEDGGFGYDPHGEPEVTCPRCEGMGRHVTVIADTTTLSGPARALVKGVKQTANGIEVLLHDADKAKDRLLRAGGYFHDDAASVARGAAAGAAAGTAAALAAARAVENMSAEDAARLYLDLA